VSFAPLTAWLLERLANPTRAWMAGAFEAAAAAGVSERFLVAWSGCGRRLGRAPLTVTDGEVSALAAAEAPFTPRGWGTDELGRGLLLLTAAPSTRDLPSALDGLFRTGEIREQQALLKTLFYLPDAERFVALAAEAVRTNVVSVLEAITCGNPYPAAHLPELAFNQLIMKAMFNQLPLGRVMGLAARLGPELRRMVQAYASERRAAGRSVPPDVDLILGGGQHASI